MLRHIFMLWAIGLSLQAATLPAQVPPDVEQRRAAERSGQAARSAALSQAEVAALVQKLDDPDPQVRSDAVSKLRILARRVDKFGAQRTQRGDVFDPKVA